MQYSKSRPDVTHNKSIITAKNLINIEHLIKVSAVSLDSSSTTISVGLLPFSPHSFLACTLGCFSLPIQAISVKSIRKNTEQTQLKRVPWDTLQPRVSSQVENDSEEGNIKSGYLISSPGDNQ